jgi:hypothetical protein
MVAFCGSVHPTKTLRFNVWRGGAEYDEEQISCKRAVGHDGDHAGYGFHINEPERWPNEPVEPVEPQDLDPGMGFSG